MATVRTKKRVLAAAIESTSGTAETLEAADGGMLISDLKWSLEIEQVARDYMTDSLSKVQPVPGKRSGSFSFSTELRGKADAFSSSNVPELGKYLQACGFSEAIVSTAGSETVTYEPTSDATAIKSLTMTTYNDGRAVKLKGCRGNVSFECNNGEFGKANFEFQGMIISVTDAPILSVDLSDEIALNPPLLLGTSFGINDGSTNYSAKIASLSVDMGNTVSMREDMSQTHGYFTAMVTDRNPTGKIDPELEGETTYPFLGNWLDGTAAEISFSYGDTQYNKVAFSIPKATTTGVGDSDRENLAVGDLDFTLNTAGDGDDEITIVFS